MAVISSLEGAPGPRLKPHTVRVLSELVRLTPTGGVADRVGHPKTFERRRTNCTVASAARSSVLGRVVAGVRQGIIDSQGDAASMIWSLVIFTSGGSIRNLPLPSTPSRVAKFASVSKASKTRGGSPGIRCNRRS